MCIYIYYVYYKIKYGPSHTNVMEQILYKIILSDNYRQIVLFDKSK